MVPSLNVRESPILVTVLGLVGSYPRRGRSRILPGRSTPTGFGESNAMPIPVTKNKTLASRGWVPSWKPPASRPTRSLRPSPPPSLGCESWGLCCRSFVIYSLERRKSSETHRDHRSPRGANWSGIPASTYPAKRIPLHGGHQLDLQRPPLPIQAPSSPARPATSPTWCRAQKSGSLEAEFRILWLDRYSP